ncbi:type I polyketide synthase [Pseudonocardia spinosispora]|uniref:type I polyketide synthase n=1 Tax=Pseudonocardia spinosispora TaxID=103441 RepID=UPI000418D1D2|nr:type I polyketide synthase [Pseudonocardia spinosispora]
MSEQASVVKQALFAVKKLQAQLDEETRKRNEPIAIVGMGCRIPGGAQNPEQFWRSLDAGEDLITEVPRGRWTDQREVNGAVRWGGFVPEVDRFDPAFFGISPREAAAMDPQQRMLLEVGWEALERAGLPPDSLVGSRTGVFAGVVVTDYDKISGGERDIYTVTGNGHSFPAGRLSYAFGFEGPSMTVDTACSSSLVAVHLACQSLRSGESTTALAGGVSLMLARDMTDMMASSGALSADGRCKTFDARANGYVRSEGCGVLVLKRLADALADQDPVLAVIRGSAVNSDGRSAGLTAPNGTAQRALLRQALRAAGVAASDVGYIETHGTGTPLGDPIEVDALADVFGAPRPDGEPCVLGAVKTNIGHLEAAAGVVGLIKAVLALRHETIPANLHLRTLNPRIDLAGTRLTLPTAPVDWSRRPERPRIAGVSSFGISGTNAHVIVAEAPEPAASEQLAGPVVVPVSARTGTALTELTADFQELLRSNPAELDAIAYTASVRRQHHEHRAVLVADRDGSSRLVTGPGGTDAPKVVFVFPGQGSQWAGMGRDLYEAEPAFRDALDTCDAAIRAETGWSVVAELHAPRSRLEPSTERIDVVQPVLFAIQVALAHWWRSAGVRPDTVLGHSMGEIAAAHVAGALTLADAVRVVCRRSRLLLRLAGKGAMALVELPVDEVRPRLLPARDLVSVAASNSPRSTVLSGDPDALDRILAELTDEGVFCRRIKVSVASHSPQVDALTGELLAELEGISPVPTTISMRSTVTAGLCDGASLGPEYWVRNLREPVLFAPAVAASGPRMVFVELSPHPILLPAIEEAGHVALASLHRDRPARTTLRESLAALYAHGYPVDWAAQHPDGARRVVELPTYRWQRERFWVDEPVRGPARVGHPLLGEPISPAALPGVRIWERAVAEPYLAEHRVDGASVLPASAYLEMAFAASGRDCLLDVSFERMAELDETGTRTMQVMLDGERLEIVGRAGDEDSWVRHASARIPAADQARSTSAEQPQAIRHRCTAETPGAEHYRRHGERGIEYGPAFRGVERVWTGVGEALGQVRSPAGGGYRCHPALLDACLQVLGGLIAEQRAVPPDVAVVPVSARRVRMRRSPDRAVWVHARLEAGRDGGDLTVFDEQGTPLIEVEGLTVARLASATPYARWLYDVEWRAAELPRPPGAEAATSPWLVLGDSSGVGAEVVRTLERRGHPCVLVAASELDRHPGLGDGAEQAWEELLARSFGEGRDCAGIVHLWSLDATAADHTTSESLESDQRVVGLSTLGLARAVLRRRWREQPRLWLVTEGAQCIDPEDGLSALSASTMWGFARTLGMEHPELGCVRVDLSRRWTAGESAQRLVPELLAPDDEDEIALRPGGRHLARLVRTSFPPGEPDPVTCPDATYLVTGGLGGLGLGLAEWLADRGAGHLVLLGRRAASPEALARLDELRARGVEVVVAAADVTKRAELASVLAHVDEHMPPLRGVLHAAMVLDDRTVLELDAARYSRVLAPKVQGAWNLHELTLGRKLDFFVLYSSAAVLLGSPGQANYAAANAFLGALARYRAGRGEPALCIDWGLYARAGIMAGRDDDGARLAGRGVGTLTPEQGTEILGRLLAGAAPQVAAVKVNLRQWLEFYPAAAGSSLFRELRGTEEHEPADAGVVDRLSAAGPHERGALVTALITENLGRVLRLDPERIDRSRSIPAMGADSLMALELRNRLEAALGVRLPVTLLFTAPTVTALGDQVLERLGLADEPRDEPDGSDLDDLSMDELLAEIDGAVDRVEGDRQ